MAEPELARNVRVLIVDDERPARAKVRRFVEADPDVSVVYEAGNGYDALEVIRAESPDIMFLDVQMPGMDGIGLLEALPRETIPHLVFLTAFDEYALKAFELHAIDYLLKPVDRERFRAAMSRAKSAVAAERGAIEIERLHQALAALREREQPVDRLMVREGNRRVLLRLEEVVRIRAARNGVVVHTDAKQFRMSETIGALEQRLSSRQFIRVNRSEIINADFITDLTAAGHGDQDIRLRDGSVVRLSRTYKDRFPA